MFLENALLKNRKYRPVVPGGTGVAMAPPDFGRSVNPIQLWGQIVPTK